jgi:hypothetical protein
MTHLVDGEVDLRDRTESRNGASNSMSEAFPRLIGSSPRPNLSVMLSAIRAISVYSRSRAPEEFGPVTAVSDARSSRVSDRILDWRAFVTAQRRLDRGQRLLAFSQF